MSFVRTLRVSKPTIYGVMIHLLRYEKADRGQFISLFMFVIGAAFLCSARRQYLEKCSV